MDPKAVRCRTLFRTGPARHEVHTRQTFDNDTGELLEVTKSFATAKIIDQELPDPRPRSLRTVFHFGATQAVIPHDAQREEGPSSASKPAQSKAAASQDRTNQEVASLREEWEESRQELRFVGQQIETWRVKLREVGLSTWLPIFRGSRDIRENYPVWPVCRVERQKLANQELRDNVLELWDKHEILKRRWADHGGRV